VFEAQYIITKSKQPGITIYSPWFPRRGDRIRYTIDIVDAIGAQITVKLFHKDTEDAGDGTDTTSAIGPTSTIGRSGVEFTRGLLELVRYQFVVTSDETNVPGYICFRMLPPVWFDAVSTT
jgi:hypothetical protein